MNWKALRELHQIYTSGEASTALLKYPIIRRQEEMGRIKIQGKKLIKAGDFDEMYERKYADFFQDISNLLSQYELSGTNFKEQDLRVLQRIKTSKTDILNQGLSQKEISSTYFDDSKYLKSGSKLYQAVSRLLEIDQLDRAEHDRQFLYVLHCASRQPKIIILCENLNRLKKPRLQDIELWYAGGSNTAKLQYVLQPDLPLYYLCDWDNNGISIYQHIKKQYFPTIELLVPEAPKLLSVISEWTISFDKNLFSTEAWSLLGLLIQQNYWIEEESINAFQNF